MYKGEKVFLRSYEKKDIERAHKLFNDLEVQFYLAPGPIYPLSYQEEEKFVESFMGREKEKGYNFAIETLEGEYIGGCGYFGLSRKNGTVEVGITIADKDYWGKGYGTDAMKVLINFLFYELNVRKITLHVFAFNERAIRCYRKLGFLEEGRLRENMFRNGRYHDDIIMSLFRQDYKYHTTYFKIDDT